LNAKSISVLIVADRDDTAELREQIEPQADFQILTALEGDRELVEKVKMLAPDAVILDTERIGKKWATVVYEINNLPQKPAVIVLSPTSKTNTLLAAFREGADAFLSKKQTEHSELMSALKAVCAGRIFYDRAAAQAIREHMRELELGSARKVMDLQNGIKQLTVREKEVFPLLADGKSVKEVAKILGISPKTVETHKYNIMAKLNLDRMADLTRMAIIKDLIPL